MPGEKVVAMKNAEGKGSRQDGGRKLHEGNIVGG